MKNLKIPACRNLDIYRLVTVRHWKQLDVAASFDVTPVRICQIVARVHAWVNQSIPDWFLEGHPELRFHAALAYERIRALESETEPEYLMLIGPGWTYVRENRVATMSGWQPSPELLHATRQLNASQPSSTTATPVPAPPDATPPSSPSPLIKPLDEPHLAPQLSPSTLNSSSAPAGDPVAATVNGPTDFSDPRLLQLASHFAEILILWNKLEGREQNPHLPELGPSSFPARSEKSPAMMTS